MPEWLSPVLVFAGILVGFLGSMMGHKITAGKNKADLQLALVDQLQEERNRLDEKIETQEKRHSEDVSKLNTRISGFYADKSASRRYISSLQAREAELVAHIILGNPPPPPGASPEPPEGYVP